MFEILKEDVLSQAEKRDSLFSEDALRRDILQIISDQSLSESYMARMLAGERYSGNCSVANESFYKGRYKGLYTSDQIAHAAKQMAKEGILRRKCSRYHGNEYYSLSAAISFRLPAVSEAQLRKQDQQKKEEETAG